MSQRKPKKIKWAIVSRYTEEPHFFLNGQYCVFRDKKFAQQLSGEMSDIKLPSGKKVKSMFKVVPCEIKLLKKI